MNITPKGIHLICWSIALLPLSAAPITSTVTAAAGCVSTGAFSASCSGMFGSASGSVLPVSGGLTLDLDARGPSIYQGPFGASVTINAVYSQPFTLTGRSGTGTVVVSFNRDTGNQSVDCYQLMQSQPARSGCVVMADLTPITTPFTFGVPFDTGFQVYAYVWADGGHWAWIHGYNIGYKNFDVYLEPIGTPGLRLLPDTGAIGRPSFVTLRLFGTDADLQRDVTTPEPAAGLLILSGLTFVARSYRKRHTSAVMFPQ